MSLTVYDKDGKIKSTTTATVNNLTDVGDVTITGTPADDEVVAYDTGTSKFINQTPAEAGLAPALGADDNYVTDAEKTVIGNTSGTNTGDQTLPVKASAAELDTGSDDAKFATALAIKNSKNVPSVAPGASGNVMKSDGTDWTSGAASGGAVATDAIWDAKGDLAGGTGADTAVKLTVGANDDVLTADSAEATGMKWATPAAGGGGTAQFIWAVDTRYLGATGKTFILTIAGGGLIEEAGGGIDVKSGTTDGGVTYLRYLGASGNTDIGGSDPFDNNLDVNLIWDWFATAPTGNRMHFWITGNTVPTAGAVITSNHIGFIGDVVSGTVIAYATNGNGTTQTKTDITSNVDVTSNSWQALRIKVTSGTNVKFYNGAGTVLATHTTNLPSGATMQGSSIVWIVGCANDAGETDNEFLTITNVTLAWDSE